MATLRSVNNEFSYGLERISVPRNEKSGEIIVSYDTILMEAPLAAGDVILCQEIPEDSRVKSVTLLNQEGVVDGEFEVGYSSSEEVERRTDESIPAVSDAFLPATALAAGTVQSAMDPETAAGYLARFNRPVFLTLTCVTAPSALDGKGIAVLVEVIGK